MRKFAFFLLALLATSSAAGAGPVRDFFNYQDPQPPIGGDCGQIASEIGAENTWYGEFAGNRIDDYLDWRQPYSARGCFKSEYACRIWQNQAVSYVGRGGIVYMRCRRGVSGY